MASAVGKGKSSWDVLCLPLRPHVPELVMLLTLYPLALSVCVPFGL